MSAPVQSPSPDKPVVKRDYTEAKLQVRQTNGQPLVHTFGAKESLAAVRLYLEMNRSVSLSPFFI